MSDSRDGLLAERAVRFGVHATDRYDAVRQCGELLVEVGAVAEEYVPSMRDREDEISTYIGAGVAIPHSTAAGKKYVRRDALAVLVLAEPVDWGEDQQVSLCVAIAALGDRHLDILAELAEVLMDPERAEQLHQAKTANEVIRLLQPAGKAENV
ncbi:phosphoenolpyruvate-dependent sugar phosphotransferase system EIIA 2 [Catenulispora acidiphila DSM 44928]|uniref:Mannitol-specific phosphotransferase enzyme IIA component n=1 Tax=Catenulispora acidiphila (strain DSM 44928 / JCM 14897 / NBRC 102108 / NRRL B-24433 / ID139908) TaxID=479433 RepID=C7Q7W1_CATAD|nr:PTS sugar transporter subunit IIA [Catenulispora acidiphila]ACU74128.1 phosphoenolpyruvate-dependent sugar phosphotransferase system EIIA 2 [Catenulispora acidiphila DSM 44928]